MAVHHHIFASAIGPCGVAWSDRGLVALQFPERDETATVKRLTARAASAGAAEPPDAVASVIAGVRRYLDGERIEFSSAAVDLADVEPFRRRIYETLRAIGYGRTTTYGELARTLGLDGWEGARDIGEAMGRNPVPIVIPCHRVLAAGGKLGGFSAPGGVATKRTLLTLEGVAIGGGAPRLPGL
jgi:methylated-DNA-[protein]-cysteine S-methyltransferase